MLENWIQITGGPAQAATGRTGTRTAQRRQRRAEPQPGQTSAGSDEQNRDPDKPAQAATGRTATRTAQRRRRRAEPQPEQPSAGSGSPHKNPLRAQIYCFIWNKARGREYKSAHRKPIFGRPKNLLHNCNYTGNKQAETHPSCLLKMRDTLPPSCWRYAEWLAVAGLEDAGAKIGKFVKQRTRADAKDRHPQSSYLSLLFVSCQISQP